MSRTPAERAGKPGDTIAYYRFEPELAAPIELPEGYVFEEFVPRLFRLRHSMDRAAPPLAMYLFWFFCSTGPYSIHYVWHGGRIVHVSHMLRRNPRLAFMKQTDLHIGPCWTDTAHRGRRLFPATIQRMAEMHGGRTIWMLADKDNSASRRGIERAGFRLAGMGSKRRGRYAVGKAGDA